MQYLRPFIRISRDPFWQSFFGLAALLLTLALFFYERPIKALQIIVLANSSLVQIDQQVSKDIDIVYKEKSINNLSLLQLIVENHGNQSIQGSDYDRPISLTFPPASDIIEAKVLESSPPGIEPTIQVEENVLKVSPGLLNPKDRFIIKVLLVDVPGDSGAVPFKVNGRITAVKDIPIITAINQQEDNLNINNTISELLLVLGLTFISYILVSIRFSGRSYIKSGILNSKDEQIKNLLKRVEENNLAIKALRSRIENPQEESKD